jgi:hypothetical protein
MWKADETGRMTGFSAWTRLGVVPVATAVAEGSDRGLPFFVRTGFAAHPGHRGGEARDSKRADPLAADAVPRGRHGGRHGNHTEGAGGASKFVTKPVDFIRLKRDVTAVVADARGGG